MIETLLGPSAKITKRGVPLVARIDGRAGREHSEAGDYASVTAVSTSEPRVGTATMGQVRQTNHPESRQSMPGRSWRATWRVSGRVVFFLRAAIRSGCRVESARRRTAPWGRCGRRRALFILMEPAPPLSLAKSPGSFPQAPPSTPIALAKAGSPLPISSARRVQYAPFERHTSDGALLSTRPRWTFPLSFSSPILFRRGLF